MSLWPLPTRCQEHSSPAVTTKNVCGHSQHPRWAGDGESPQRRARALQCQTHGWAPRGLKSPWTDLRNQPPPRRTSTSQPAGGGKDRRLTSMAALSSGKLHFSPRRGVLTDFATLPAPLPMGPCERSAQPALFQTETGGSSDVLNPPADRKPSGAGVGLAHGRERKSSCRQADLISIPGVPLSLFVPSGQLTSPVCASVSSPVSCPAYLHSPRPPTTGFAPLPPRSRSSSEAEGLLRWVSAPNSQHAPVC